MLYVIKRRRINTVASQVVNTVSTIMPVILRSHGSLILPWHNILARVTTGVRGRNCKNMLVVSARLDKVKKIPEKRKSGVNRRDMK